MSESTLQTPSAAADHCPPPTAPLRHGRPRRHPSARNLRLYHELLTSGAPQSHIAARFRVSRPRVAQIRADVERWVASQLPADLSALAAESPQPSNEAARRCTEPVVRLHLAIAVRRVQLEASYAENLAPFGGTAGVRALANLLAASDAGRFPTDYLQSLPRRPVLDAAVKMARVLDDVAAIAQLGPFPNAPADYFASLQPKTEPPAEAENASHQRPAT
jgi:hypothetical protein